MKTKILGLLVILALAAGFYVSVTQKPQAPDVTVVKLDGSLLKTADLRGKVTLVNFWATTCTTCVKEMPQIVATYNQYHAKGYETVAIAMDYDPADYVANYQRQNALPFTVARDEKGDAAKAFDNVRLTPTSFLLDKQGRIVQKYLGEPDFRALGILIERLLAE